MEKQKCIMSFILAFLIFFASAHHVLCSNSNNGESNELKTYIVHVAQPEGTAFSDSADRETWYSSFLPTSTFSTNDNNSRLLYSYEHVISGFAARLTSAELKEIEKKSGFLHAQPDRHLQLQTTRTPQFLGLNTQNGFLNGSNYGKGIIIGLLDTGVFPNHPSFSGDGMSPPPAKWKGRCDFNASQCNNKLIGARSFSFGSQNARGLAVVPPTDDDGHGTHTSSTAAGNFVNNANVLSNAQGTAVGMAPRAHLAMYKVCSDFGCTSSDILAGMDAAVADGVDVLSLSLGGPSIAFFEDSIAIGAFGAIQKGIFVSCSAGNSGPTSSTLSNEAPWILTVGASTMDRKIIASVKLGYGNVFDGETLYQPKNFTSTFLPLIYAGASGSTDAKLCGPDSLNSSDVNGKVVLCERGNYGRIAKGVEVQRAGGAAMILMNQEENAFSTIADPHVIPASHVSFVDGLKTKSYINLTHNPVATLMFKGTVLGTPAPVITSFSSRGPSLASPGILKPDIIGPGVSVLAAWPFAISPPLGSKDGANFNIISGTSMSCPHLSGLAALIKSSHPDWSPAAIKSAIMTTAQSVNNMETPIADQRLLQANFFALGAGHVDPTKANDPGLVYDLSADDYIPYLCGLGYTSTQVQLIVRHSVNCSTVKSITEVELNYPSISVTFSTAPNNVVFTRTVTNVGEAFSRYEHIVSSDLPLDISVVVEPATLQFSSVGEKKSFIVTFTGKVVKKFSEANLVWFFEDKHSVRSPISITLKA